MRPTGIGPQPLGAAFRNAFVGIRDFARERNSRIQFTAGVAAIGLGMFCKLPRGEWMILVLAIAGVLSLEAVNCAIERVVDLASPGRHELARQAKDLAAGAVLIASIGAAVVGVILFVPRLTAMWAS